MPHQWGKLDPDRDPDGQAGSFTGRLVSLQENLEAINFMPRQSAIPVAISARPLDLTRQLKDDTP